MVVLQDTKNGKASSMADLQAQLDALKAENPKLKEARHKSLSFKISEKGALSGYGLGRFPVTLYRGQWERLIEAVSPDQGVYRSQRQHTDDEGLGHDWTSANACPVLLLSRYFPL